MLNTRVRLVATILDNAALGGLLHFHSTDAIDVTRIETFFSPVQSSPLNLRLLDPFGYFKDTSNIKDSKRTSWKARIAWTPLALSKPTPYPSPSAVSST